MVINPFPSPLIGAQYGKMEPRYPEDDYYQIVLHAQGYL